MKLNWERTEININLGLNEEKNEKKQCENFEEIKVVTTADTDIKLK